MIDLVPVPASAVVLRTIRKGRERVDHTVRMLPNGIECSCGEKRLLNYVAEDRVVQGLVLQHWIEVGKLPSTHIAAGKR
jgi:hypothetical protein